MDSLFFFGVTTIGACNSVTSVTGVIMFCACKRSNSASNLSRSVNGMKRGVLLQKS